MVKQTQKNCWLFPTNCLSVFRYFVWLAIKELMIKINPLVHNHKILKVCLTVFSTCCIKRLTAIMLLQGEILLVKNFLMLLPKSQK